MFTGDRVVLGLENGFPGFIETNKIKQKRKKCAEILQLDDENNKKLLGLNFRNWRL